MRPVNSGQKAERSTVQRRRFLQTTGVVATGFVAGCLGNGGDDGDGGGDGPTETPGDHTATDTPTEAAADFPSQDITWFNGGSSGGGFDQYSRGVAQFLPEHLPNEVEVLVQTMGSWTQANSQINRADPDGHTVGIVNVPGNVTTQVLQDRPWDLTEFSWIARLARSIYLMCVPADSAFESVEDLQNADRTLKFASTGSGTSMLSTILGGTALGLDFDLVTGYQGSPEMVTATLRGDTDAVQLPATTDPIVAALEQGELRPLLYYGTDPPDSISGVTTVADAGYPELEGQANLQRLVGGPPDIPDERVSVIESGIQDTLESDAFLEWAEQQGRPVDFAGADETAQAVSDAVTFVQENRDVFEEFY